MAAHKHWTFGDTSRSSVNMNDKEIASASSLSSLSASSSSSPQHILPQEEQFLEMYFNSVSHFAFDRAKELVDQEKEVLRSQPGSLWGSLVNALSVLVSAEKAYMHLAFLEQKWFGRQSGKWLFSSAMSDVRRVELRGNQVGQPGSSPEDHLLSHLCEQLVHFIEARQEMMDLYEKVCNLGHQKADINIADQITAVASIIARHSKQFHHPILGSMRSNLMVELEALHAQLESVEHLTEFNFLPALLSLKECQCKVDEWGASLKLREVKKKLLKTLAPGKVTGIPPLMVWYVRFQAAQLSKFSLYFHETLSKQSLPGEMRTHLSNLSIEYYTKIAAFQKKCDALNVSLVFDTRGLEDTYKGHGYHHPNSFCEPPKGLDSYPAIFSFPNERPIHLWPNLIMLLPSAETGTFDRVIHFYDKTQQITYYICRVDIKMSLVIIFEAKKSERDSHINNFLQEMGQLLRVNKLFASLRQGAKTRP